MFLSLADRDKPAGLEAARQFAALGFELAATSGTAAMLEAEGIAGGHGGGQGGRRRSPGVVDAVDLIAGGKVQLVVNTPRGRGPRADGLHIRATALAHLVPCLTTVAAARAAAAGIADWISHRCRCARCRSTTGDEPVSALADPATAGAARLRRAWRAVARRRRRPVGAGRLAWSCPIR